ncbi:MAG TPA: signal peptidase II [Gammaproteobacteria bacterium]|nr:signal peptidase II [Gammaproteobacteria bacterium]
MYWPWLLALGWVALDQASKLAVVAFIPPHRAVELVPGLLNLVHAHNRGAAFGMLDEGSGWQLVVLAAVAVAVIAGLGAWLFRLGRREPGTRLALALILGGAAGNLVDRLRVGYVVDFVDVHWREVYHYPAFNVADSGITLGAVLLVILLIREESRP